MARTPLLQKLRSQRAEMKAATDAGFTIVYGYLRAKDSGTAKAGSLYYVGIGNSHTRAFQVHSRGGKRSALHNVPVPKNEALVRQLGVFPTRAAAAKREQKLIARYGRKGLDKNGVLLNRSVGGEKSALGWKMSANQRKELSDRRKTLPGRGFNSASLARQKTAAAKLGVPLAQFQEMTRPEKLKMMGWVSNNPGKTGKDYLSLSAEDLRENRRLGLLRKGAKKYGVPYDVWITLSTAARKNVGKRYGRGKRGAALLEGF